MSTVTATLDHASSEATTVTVSATPVSPAVAGDFTLSGSTTLSIAAGATTTPDSVTITAVDNGVDAPDKRVTVSATATNTHRVNAPKDVTLTITDDESTPTVDAGADALFDRGGRRREHGDGDAEPRFERGDHVDRLGRPRRARRWPATSRRPARRSPSRRARRGAACRSPRTRTGRAARCPRTGASSPCWTRISTDSWKSLKVVEACGSARSERVCCARSPARPDRRRRRCAASSGVTSSR